MIESEDLGALAREAVAEMRSSSAEIQSEVYLSSSRERVLSRREEKRESVETAVSSGAGVRVAREGRAGFACGSDLGALRGLWKAASEQLPHVESVRQLQLPSPAADAADAEFSASLWDEAIFHRSWEELETGLAQAEAAARTQYPCARILRSRIVESGDRAAVANTRGAFADQRGGSVSVSIAVAAEDGAEVQVGEGFRSSRRFDDLEFQAAGREAARRAAAGIGAGRVRAGRRAVVFEPWVAVEFLEIFSDLLSADEVRGGRSLLQGRLGGAVASTLVTLRDDPRLPGGPASARFDDEGVRTRDKAMIDKGILRELFYDASSAARAGVSSNGCGYRDGWRGLPRPTSSNFFLAPGPGSREALLSDTRDGIIVLEILGAHMADSVSGEFSVGVSGFEIEKGALGRPFKGAMIAGNILDLLARVDAVADDLAFYGSYGAPTFRVAALDVA